MSEHIISDDCLDYIRARSYEAGQRGQEVYTVRGPDGEEVVRCRDCKWFMIDPDPVDPGWPMMCELMGNQMVSSVGFCAWGEKRKCDG